jgi:ABC-2 type transport system ATP-binding protein
MGMRTVYVLPRHSQGDGEARFQHKAWLGKTPAIEIVPGGPPDALYGTERSTKPGQAGMGPDDARVSRKRQDLERVPRRMVLRRPGLAPPVDDWNHVNAVIQYSRNSYLLQLDDAAESSIPLSRQSERALQNMLGY